MEKSLLTFTLAMIVLISHQIFYVYMKKQKVRCNDGRLVLLSMCLVALLYVFFHYGILRPTNRHKVFAIIGFSRFYIMCSLCIYYCDKASRLLLYGPQILVFLKIWGLICFIVYLVIAVRIFTMADPGDMLCVTFEFNLIRIFPFSVCIIFGLIYLKIKKEVLA